MSQFCNVCIYDTLTYQELNVSRGETIFREGEPLFHIYRIDEGYVKVVKYHETGDEKIINVFGPGDVLALLIFLQNQKAYIATAIALSDVKLRKISISDADQAYHKNTSFKETCLSCATQRANIFMNHLFQTSSTDVDEKILGILLHLYRKFGSYSNQKHCLYLPINQTDLASIIGIRRETLSRRLGALQDEGVISIVDHTYCFFKI